MPRINFQAIRSSEKAVLVTKTCKIEISKHAKTIKIEKGKNNKLLTLFDVQFSFVVLLLNKFCCDMFD